MLTGRDTSRPSTRNENGVSTRGDTTPASRSGSTVVAATSVDSTGRIGARLRRRLVASAEREQGGEYRALQGAASCGATTSPG